MVQAVILAGGKGTRLAARLNGKPKPLVEIDGIPLLTRQIATLAANGVTEALLLVNHAADQIQSFIAQADLPIPVRLIDDGEPRGTAGAVLACIDALRDVFVVVYGDTLFDIDLAAMLVAHAHQSAGATLLLHPNDHPFDSDLVDLGEDGLITAFHSYPHPQDAWLRNLVNAAFYIVNRSSLAGWAGRINTGDFAKDLFPAMLAHGERLAGYVSFEYIKDVGTPARLDKAEAQLRAGVVARMARSAPQKAVFLDRDGTLNHLKGHLARAEDLVLFDGVGEALRKLNLAEYRLVIVTNQPVIARGECSPTELSRIHARLESEIGKNGAYIDAIYYCPHHPDAGFIGEVASLKIVCGCRKPGTLMVDQAVEALNIDLAQSWMVGDSTADVMLARQTGLKSVLLATGEAGADGKWPEKPDFHAAGIRDAVELILEHDLRSATTDSSLLENL
jgi:histidinol-phosphate phosphatase family protein